MENYETVGNYYEQLKIVSPDIAEKYAYLDVRVEGFGRADDAGGLKGVVLWNEE